MRTPLGTTTVMTALVLVLAACGGSAASPATTPAGPGATATSTPGLGGPGSAPAGSDSPANSGPPGSDSAPSPSCTDACSPPPSTSGNVIDLHGTFTGHWSDSLVTADQTVEVLVRWTQGPDDVHDRDAFVFVSGNFTFSESIAGVCGGARSEGGPLRLTLKQFLTSGDPQDRNSAQVVMVDQRLNGGGLQLSPSASYLVSNPDPDGCADLSRGGVGVCTLVFLQTAADRLQPDATCTHPSGTYSWTGHLGP